MGEKIDFDLIGRLKRMEAIENPYQRFSLTRNPFPRSAIADPHSAEFFSRSRKEALEHVREFVLYSYRSKKWAGLIISGEYGYGKSHILFYVFDEINKQLGNLDKDRAIAIYIEHPKDTINELYSDFIEQIGRDRFMDYVAKTLEKYLLESLERFTYSKPLTPEEGSMDSVRKLKELGNRLIPSKKNIAWETFARDIVSKNIILHRDFAKCLAVMMTEHDPILVNSAWNFLIGKRTGRREAKILGLLSEMASEDEIIKYVFPSVINILNNNDISMIFLLLDELEKIAPKPKQAAFEFLENMRSLIDNNLRHFSMIMSCVSEAWEILQGLSPGLVERISEVTELKPLSNLEAQILTEDFLGLARKKGFSGDAFAPFTRDSLDEINHISKGSVRYILENCHIILESASIDENIDRTIDRDYVMKVLRG